MSLCGWVASANSWTMYLVESRTHLTAIIHVSTYTCYTFASAKSQNLVTLKAHPTPPIHKLCFDGSGRLGHAQRRTGGPREGPMSVSPDSDIEQLWSCLPRAKGYPSSGASPPMAIFGGGTI